jgi:uncharacterized membrane protein
MPTPHWSDEKVDQFIGAILQAGVLAAGILVLAGGILYLIHFGPSPVNYHVFRGERAELRSIWPVLVGAVNLDSRSIIQLGILLLIATPVIRVAFSVVAFGVQRDHI